MLTRQQQLEAKNKAKETNEEAEQDANAEDEPSMKRPAAKASSRAKAKAKAKTKAKAKAKAKTSPKKRVRGKKSKKENEDETEAKPDPVKRKLFEMEDGEEEAHEHDEEVEAEEEVPMKKPAGRSRASKEGTSEKAEKKKPRAKASAKSAPEPEPKAKAKAKAEGKKRARRSNKPIEELENVESMRDDVMKGVVLQVLKEVENLPYDGLQKKLNAKKDSSGHANINCRYNIYWTRCSGAVTLTIDGPPYPDAGSFCFKTGSWNTRMAAAYMCVYLAATRLIGSNGNLSRKHLVLRVNPTWDNFPENHSVTIFQKPATIPNTCEPFSTPPRRCGWRAPTTKCYEAGMLRTPSSKLKSPRSSSMPSVQWMSLTISEWTVDFPNGMP